MNNIAREILMRRRRDKAYYDRYDYNRDDYKRYDIVAYDHARTYPADIDRAYTEGFEKGYDKAKFDSITPYGEHGMTVNYDGRQGVKGTGKYGIGGSMYYDRASEDMRLTREDMAMWKHNLMNADGSMGEHFQKPQIEQAMVSLGIQPRDYTPEELCMTANMMYSDYYNTLKNIIPKEKEAMYYTAMARDFLEDKDSSVRGGEKLAIYYYCIADKE